MVRKTIICLWVVLVMNIAAVLPAKAATYYVSSTGNDSNIGSISQPWKTIQKAVSTMVAGDIGIIRAGSYAENVTWSRSGTSSQPITLRGENGTLWIGKDVTAKTPCLSATGDYLTIEGVAFSHCFGPAVQTGTGASFMQIRNNRVEDAVEAGLYIQGDNHLVEGNDISKTRNYLTETLSYITDADGIRFFGNNHTFRSNYIHDINHTYARTGTEPHIDCFQNWGGVHDVLFEKNTCRLQNSSQMIKFTMIEGGTSVYNLTYRNNVFVNESATTWTPIQIGSEGCDANSKSSNIKMFNNTFIRPSGANTFGVLLRCVDGVIIQNNSFYNMHGASSSYNYIELNRDVLNATIDHNSVYNSNGINPANGGYLGDRIPGVYMVNPQFSNVTIGDVHLLASSPLINRGLTIPEVTDDMDKEVRPQGTGYEIGADEYVSGVVVSTPTPTPIPIPTIAITPTSNPTVTPTPGGNELSVCNSGCQYTSIQAAVNAVLPGQTIVVRSGIYNESVVVGKSGTSTSWITLKARDGDVVWIDGSGLAAVSNINLQNRAYWKIQGLKMRYAGNSLSPTGTSSHIDGITVGTGGHDLIIQNVEIREPDGDGVDLEGGNYNVQIYDSEIYDMRIAHPSYDGDGHGIHVVQANNTIASHDILVKGNFVHDSHGKACLGLADYSDLGDAPPKNIVFEYNKIFDCTNGIKVNADGVFRYNLIVDTGKGTAVGGFQAYTHDPDNNVRDAQIYNNTVVGHYYSYDFAVTGATENQIITVFKNNIGYNPRYYYVRVTQTDFATGAKGNNMYYGKSLSAFSGYTSVASEIFADPGFVDFANNIFTLSQNSPAIDKGVIVNSGQIFWGSAPDIGAFEYGFVENTPTPVTIKPGDADGDGDVDGADYARWLMNYEPGVQKTGGMAIGDFNLNRYVDGLDYAVWLGNYGS